MLMRVKDETLREYANYYWDNMFEPMVYSTDWERIIDTTYEYEASCRKARSQDQTVQK